MSKIKALNEVKKGIFGNITGTQILIGLVIAVGVFLVIKQFT